MSEQSEPPAPGVERVRKAKPDLPPKTRSAVLIDADYVIRNDETRVRLQFKAKSVFYLYDRYEPYFYLDAPASEIPELMKANAFHRGLTIHPMRIEEVEREVEGHRRKVLKVFAKHPPEVPDLRAAYKDRKAWEYNIPFGRRYMIDLGLGPLTRIRYERKGRRIVKILSKKDASTAFKILAFDIETYNPRGVPRPERDECIMISYATGLDANEGHVHTWRDAGGKDFCQISKDEKGMIEAFGDDVAREDPDILAGYNSTQFDLPYMEARAKATKASLRLGRDGSSFTIRRRGIRDIAKIRGRIYVDVLPLLRFLSFIGAIKRPNNFTLDATASELLGKKKGDVERLDIWQMWDDPAQRGKLAEYSRTDSHLTWELARLVLPLELEMAKITYLPLNDVVGATASQLVESLLMHEAVARHALVPNKPGDDVAKSRLENPIEGAYVKTPSPGIYENMVVFDFRGLYPSIIISHNIDPFTLNCSCCTKAESYVSPTGARFCSKKHGLIPDVLAKVIKARGELKDKLKTLAPESDEYRSMFARQQSLKILANSYYGYLAFSRSRYYSREAAESVTAWGRHYIMQTGESAEKAGYKLLYQDSLHYDRPIVVQKPDGEIELVKIGEFVRRNKKNPELKKYRTLAFDGEKPVFKSILRAIEHEYDSQRKGKMLEFVTTHGKTVVTPQHSVYCFDSEKKQISLADAKNLKVGNCLVSMTNPPLPENHQEGESIDILDLDFGPYAHEIRAYADLEMFSPKRKGSCPYCKKNPASLYSHVSLQHNDRKLTIAQAKKTGCAWIGGANAGTGRIPRFWKLTKELAWIMGYYCAEGSASERSATSDKTMISFGSQDRKTIERVKKYFDSVLKDDLAIVEDYDKRISKNTYYYRVQRIPLVALFKYGFGMGNLSSGKRVAPIIFSASHELKSAFVDGYMEGDGLRHVQPRYKTFFQAFSTKSPELAMGLQLLLKHLPHGKNSFGKRIAHVNWNYRRDKPGIVDLRMCGVKRGAEEHGCFALARIKEIREREEHKSVFDLEVEGEHNFVDAEGLLLVHNTDSCFLMMGAKSKEDVLAWMKTVNSDLPGGMELELEAFYPRGVFVSKKTAGAGGSEAGSGAKKKYALADEKGRIKIRGFELVRRDWSVVARDTQRRVLEAILKDGSKDKAIAIVRETVEKLRSGKMDLEKLAIQTQLTKDLDKYEVKSPELAAALKANKRGKGEKFAKGSIVRYVITRSGTGSGDGEIDKSSKGTHTRSKNSKVTVSEKAELLEYAKDYDADYYIDHQVIPTVLKILKELGVTEDDLKVKGKQSGLGSYF